MNAVKKVSLRRLGSRRQRRLRRRRSGYLSSGGSSQHLLAEGSEDEEDEDVGCCQNPKLLSAAEEGAFDLPDFPELASSHGGFLRTAVGNDDDEEDELMEEGLFFEDIRGTGTGSSNKRSRPKVAPLLPPISLLAGAEASSSSSARAPPAPAAPSHAAAAADFQEDLLREASGDALRAKKISELRRLASDLGISQDLLEDNPREADAEEAQDAKEDLVRMVLKALKLKADAKLPAAVASEDAQKAQRAVKESLAELRAKTPAELEAMGIADPQEALASYPFLEKFLKDSAHTAKELRRKQSRYYGEEEKAHTDDGHLNKGGLRGACLVCLQTGHRAPECSRIRCLFCFETGHSMRDCPQKNCKCERCGLRGHFTRACPNKEFSDSRKWSFFRHIRCVQCGEEGHANCHDVRWSGQPFNQAQVAPPLRRTDSASSRKSADRMKSALLGRRPSGKDFKGIKEDNSDAEAEVSTTAEDDSGSEGEDGKGKSKGGFRGKGKDKGRGKGRGYHAGRGYHGGKENGKGSGKAAGKDGGRRMESPRKGWGKDSGKASGKAAGKRERSQESGKRWGKDSGKGWGKATGKDERSQESRKGWGKGGGKGEEGKGKSHFSSEKGKGKAKDWRAKGEGGKGKGGGKRKRKDSEDDLPLKLDLQAKRLREDLRKKMSCQHGKNGIKSKATGKRKQPQSEEEPPKKKRKR
eukprot:TRINITY_DN27578_c0_g1_i1.p1 TRINITY_DN27578_c0_g1~~TRINITY_DN27578_c0_g1_i1.p1  ORF type:complete len:696 (+),score=197.76 TRINITY_DN27578_c0_g1_i1:175-2262(+)